MGKLHVEPKAGGATQMCIRIAALLALAAPPVGSPTVFPGLGVTIAGRAAGWNTSSTRDGGWGQPQSWLNLTFGLHDFVNGSAEGPWTLDTPHVSATVTRGARRQRSRPGQEEDQGDCGTRFPALSLGRPQPIDRLGKKPLRAFLWSGHGKVPRAGYSHQPVAL